MRWCVCGPREVYVAFSAAQLCRKKNQGFLTEILILFLDSLGNFLDNKCRLCVHIFYYFKIRTRVG